MTDNKIEFRHHRSAWVETDTIDLQILHNALDVVARFGKRNAFHPIIKVAWWRRAVLATDRWPIS
jgi:hypothetical protein